MSLKKRLSQPELTNNVKRSKNSQLIKPSTSDIKISDKLDESFNELNDSVIEKNDLNISWNRFYTFIEYLLKNDRNELSKKKGNCTFSSLLSNEQIKEWPDLDEIQKLFRCFYIKAVSIKKISLTFGLERVKEMFSEDSFVTTHPDYPKSPFSAYFIYLRKMNLPICSSNVTTFQNSDDPIVIESIQEAEKQRINFYEELKEFLKKHRNFLLPNHIKYIEKKLDSENKKKKDYIAVKINKRNKKEKITPFEIYKKSKNHKFLDLPFEEREAKLQRHYEKLSDEKKKIFEELALND